MTQFISRIHQDLREARAIRRGSTHTPDNVLRGLHKEYPRMPKIALPAPAPLAMRLDEALIKRASFTRAHSARPFTTSELGTLLGHALGMRTKIARKYPSGGALYPVETYLIGKVLEDFSPGAFHYHPTAHALEHLWDVAPDFKMTDLTRSPSTPLSQVLLVFTAVWARSSMKYGDWAYHLAMLEAGHMAQNILLTATATQTQARPVGGFDDSINELLDLDLREQAIYSILLSPGMHTSSADEIYE